MGYTCEDRWHHSWDHVLCYKYAAKIKKIVQILEGTLPLNRPDTPQKKLRNSYTKLVSFCKVTLKSGSPGFPVFLCWLSHPCN